MLYAERKIALSPVGFMRYSISKFSCRPMGLQVFNDSRVTTVHFIVTIVLASMKYIVQEMSTIHFFVPQTSIFEEFIRVRSHNVRHNTLLK